MVFEWFLTSFRLASWPQECRCALCPGSAQEEALTKPFTHIKQSNWKWQSSCPSIGTTKTIHFSACRESGCHIREAVGSAILRFGGLLPSTQPEHASRAPQEKRRTYRLPQRLTHHRIWSFSSKAHGRGHEGFRDQDPSCLCLSCTPLCPDSQCHFGRHGRVLGKDQGRAGSVRVVSLVSRRSTLFHVQWGVE